MVHVQALRSAVRGKKSVLHCVKEECSNLISFNLFNLLYEFIDKLLV